MSSLTFMDRNGGAAVSGREYTKFGSLLTGLAWRAVQDSCDPHERNGPSVLRDAVQLPAWVASVRFDDFAQHAGLYLRTSGDDAEVRLPGQPAGTLLDTALNTVVTAFGAATALAVRLYAQAGVNAWIDGPDRDWLAAVIEWGRDAAYPPQVANGYTGSLPLFADRPSVNGKYDGWPAVVKYLRADDRHAVVLTYSVTGGFPSQLWAGREGDDRGEFRQWWKTATPEQRWDASERGLREDTIDQPALQITPGNLHTPMFGTNPATWPQVAAAWRDHHLRKEPDPS